MQLTLWNVPTIPLLENAPEALNCVCVDRSDHILISAVALELMGERVFQKPITGMFIRMSRDTL